MTKILLVEDDKWLGELYVDAVSAQGGVEALLASSAESALAALDEHSDISLIVLDMFLPDHNGIEFLHEIASYTDIAELPVIVLSSIYQHDFNISQERWRHYGVVEYLYKPETKPDQLVIAIKKQLIGVTHDFAKRS